jgi:hypothetical protein
MTLEAANPTFFPGGLPATASPLAGAPELFV